MKLSSLLGTAFCMLASTLPACAASDGGSPPTDDKAAAGGSAGAGAGTASGAATGSGGNTNTGGVPATGTGGAGGTPSSGGASGTGGTNSVEANACITSGSQVILMGDSYINWVTHTFPADLNAAAGQTFRDYAIGGYSMGSGGIGLIPTQFPTAIAADPDIKVIVLDGGGNDILVPDTVQFPQGGSCKNDLNSPNIPDCQKIVQKAIDTAVSLMDDVAAQGVTDVIFFFYPHVPEGTLIGGLHPNAILDYALPKVKAACDSAETVSAGKLRCHFVDMIPVFDGHPDWFVAGDIHPNSLGSQAMAQAVWQKMQSACVGQTSANSCCVAP